MLKYSAYNLYIKLLYTYMYHILYNLIYIITIQVPEGVPFKTKFWCIEIMHISLTFLPVVIIHIFHWDAALLLVWIKCVSISTVSIAQ
jgi:hypothetical protein